MSITVQINDDSGLTSASVWITGHGIPGAGPAVQLMALTSAGKFAAAATRIASARCAGSTATLELAARAPAHLAAGDSVFLAGVAPAGYNGLFTLTQVSGSTLEYSVADTLRPGEGGTAYYSPAITPAVAVVAAKSVQYAKGSGIAQLTTRGSHGLRVGQTIYLQGLAAAGYEGTSSVTQVLSSTSFQYAYTATQELSPATAGGSLWAVGLSPVKLSALPQSTLSSYPQITLDAAVDGYSAKLIVFVSSDSKPPHSLPFDGNLVTPTDPATPPFPPGLAKHPVFDIVEFAYIAGAKSTFDVSAVDGLAVPMTLTSSEVTTKPSSVGVQTSKACNRSAIGKAFLSFVAAEPRGASFADLLYASEVTRAGIALLSSSWSNNTASFTTATVHGLHRGDWVRISGVSQAGYSARSQVQKVPTPNTFTLTNTDPSLKAATGGTVTPLVFGTPQRVDDEYYLIAAPKDWLGNQPSSLAATDPLASYWDDTLDRFFAEGKYLSIYLGKDPDHPTYTGSCNGQEYTLGNGAKTYTFPKPTGGSLANALYVWGQANASGGDQGLLQDQIWQALCRGVALDGVLDEAPASPSSSSSPAQPARRSLPAKSSDAPPKSKPSPPLPNASTTAWNDSTKWYTRGTYCVYSKFLHQAALSGRAATAKEQPIFLEGAAYGFGEDENPIGPPPYSGPLVPSKLDGTVPDGATITLRIAPWKPAKQRPA